MCARRASRLLMLLLAGCVAQTGSFALRGLGPVALPRSLLRSSPQGFPSTGQSIVRSSLVAKLRPDKEAPRGMRRVLLSAVCLFLLVRTFLVEPYYIPSMSMYPTLLVNDQIAVEKFSRFLAPPQRGDLVVFSPPPNYLNSRGQVAKESSSSYPARSAITCHHLAASRNLPSTRHPFTSLHSHPCTHILPIPCYRLPSPAIPCHPMPSLAITSHPLALTCCHLALLDAAYSCIRQREEAMRW